MNELKEYAIDKYKRVENIKIRNRLQWETEQITQVKRLVWESVKEELSEFLSFEEFADIDVTFGGEYKLMGDHHIYFMFDPHKAMAIKVHTTNGKIDAIMGGHKFEVADLFRGSVLVNGFDNFMEALGFAYYLWDSMGRMIEMK